MHRRFLMIFFTSALLLWGFSSCKKLDEYPKEPQITFKNFYKIPSGAAADNYGIIEVDFTDGDGDVGLSETNIYPPFDSSSVYYYNFFIDYFEKQRGTWVKPVLYETFNARIPVLNTSNGDQPLKGTISIQVPINNFTSTYDTIRFDCRICDRALNMSNTVTTPEIIIKKH